jgi:hypothetical protein
MQVVPKADEQKGGPRLARGSAGPNMRFAHMLARGGHTHILDRSNHGQGPGRSQYAVRAYAGHSVPYMHIGPPRGWPGPRPVPICVVAHMLARGWPHTHISAVRGWPGARPVPICGSRRVWPGGGQTTYKGGPGVARTSAGPNMWFDHMLARGGHTHILDRSNHGQGPGRSQYVVRAYAGHSVPYMHIGPPRGWPGPRSVPICVVAHMLARGWPHTHISAVRGWPGARPVPICGSRRCGQGVAKYSYMGCPGVARGCAGLNMWAMEVWPGGDRTLI